MDKEFRHRLRENHAAHDPNDFLVGQRHGLEQIRVMNDDATINRFGGKYEGLDRTRRAAASSRPRGPVAIVKVEDHAHNVGCCYRCKDDGQEPLTSDQWFVKMAPLAEPAVKAVTDGDVKVPARAAGNIYELDEQRPTTGAFPANSGGGTAFLLLRRLRENRRLPHRPRRLAPTAARRCAARRTCWTHGFSSALWPFSTLGWPEDTADLRRYYPTSVLVTGYDIIFFWVARMIFSGLEHTGKAPFHTVLFHGLVRDA